MKRPEGFDRTQKAQPVDKKLKAPRSARAGAVPSTVGSAGAPAQSTDPARSNDPARSTDSFDPYAARDLRRAGRTRRRYEKSEVRRFTRGSRRRRVAWIVAIGIAVTMIAAIAIAVYSPLLALKTIEIDGTSRLDEKELHAAVDGQLDTPLALLDFDRFEEELAEFPLIRSYVTETVPPNTLRIHIAERDPIGSLPSATGFTVVDPAGIVIQESADRMPGVPLIEIGGNDSDSASFDAAVEVLVALPDPVLAQLDTITATTKDDVRLTLASSGASIIWGSADDSERKARVLARALELGLPDVSEYNVSAPGQITYR